MVKHGALVLATDATEVAQKTATVGHHLGEADLLRRTLESSSLDPGLKDYIVSPPFHPLHTRLAQNGPVTYM